MGWKINRKEWRSLSLFVVVLAVVVAVLAATSPKKGNHQTEMAVSAVERGDSVITSDAAYSSIESETSGSDEPSAAGDKSASKRTRSKRSRQKSDVGSPKPKDSPFNHPVERLNKTE